MSVVFSNCLLTNPCLQSRSEVTYNRLIAASACTAGLIAILEDSVEACLWAKCVQQLLQPCFLQRQHEPGLQTWGWIVGVCWLGDWNVLHWNIGEGRLVRRWEAGGVMWWWPRHGNWWRNGCQCHPNCSIARVLKATAAMHKHYFSEGEQAWKSAS